MRSNRLKVDPALAAMVYFVTANLVNGMLLSKHELNYLRARLRRVEEFCGVKVLGYVLMGTHLHLMVLVPKSAPVSDQELLRREAILHPPKPGKRYWGGTCTLEQLAKNEPFAQEWRQRKLRLMGDISACMQMVLQVFAQWYNALHHREGPLWRGRFHSTMNQPSPAVMRTMAAYIDLNPVGAGLVQDPLDYPFCGYAEAVAGGVGAREGLRLILGGEPGRPWQELQAEYRLILFEEGLTPRSDKVPIDPERFRQVLREGGHLSRSTVLRCKVRHFTNGAVLGTRDWVGEQIDLYLAKTRCRRRPQPLSLPANLGLGEFCLLRRVRGEAIQPGPSPIVQSGVQG